MIYLSKNNQTIVLTDNVVDYIPGVVDVYLDDVLIGNFENQYHNNRKILFTFPNEELEEREYIMKIYSNEVLIKQELVIVKDLTESTPKSVTNTKKIKMYEK
jgi:hypothetical protein